MTSIAVALTTVKVLSEGSRMGNMGAGKQGGLDSAEG